MGNCCSPSRAEAGLPRPEKQESVGYSKERRQTQCCSDLRLFSLKELKTATDNFPGEGEVDGEVGGVFQGWVDQVPVLVKVLKPEGLQAVREWVAEVQVLGSMHHPNLLKLEGYCCERGRRVLVYEWVGRGSLADHLFGGGSVLLGWRRRMEIALGAAQGIAYLHAGRLEGRVVLYRDFKTSTVLLDSQYRAKLWDFALAEEGEGESSFVSTRVMATHGYGAPEFVMSGYLVPKSNVYSFGVVLLELVTGRRAMDKSRASGEQNLVEWAKPYLTSGSHRLLQIVDPSLDGHFSIVAACSAARLAHRCLSLDPRLRPSMSQVAEALEQLLRDLDSDLDLDLDANLPPPPPAYYTLLSPPPPPHISDLQAQLRAISESQ